MMTIRQYPVTVHSDDTPHYQRALRSSTHHVHRSRIQQLSVTTATSAGPNLMSDLTPDELAFQMVRESGSTRAAYVHIWGPKDFSALKRAFARHPATESKNVLQEAVEADYATDNGVLATVADLDEYRRRRS